MSDGGESSANPPAGGTDEVDLRGKGLSDTSLQTVLDGLPAEGALRLRLGDNRLTDGCVPFLAQLLEQDRLRALDLGDMQLGHNGFIALAAAVEKNRTLLRLELGGSRSGHPREGKTLLVSAALNHPTLRLVDFGSLTVAAVTHLVALLPAARLEQLSFIEGLLTRDRFAVVHRAQNRLPCCGRR